MYFSAFQNIILFTTHYYDESYLEYTVHNLFKGINYLSKMNEYRFPSFLLYVECICAFVGECFLITSVIVFASDYMIAL